jgi:hypothetical protein
MIPELFLVFLAIVIFWAFFVSGHGSGGSSHGGANDPEAARQKAQAIKEAAIQAVIDAEARGEIDFRTRNQQIAHLSRTPTGPQDGAGGSR